MILEMMFLWNELVCMTALLNISQTAWLSHVQTWLIWSHYTDVLVGAGTVDCWLLSHRHLHLICGLFMVLNTLSSESALLTILQSSVTSGVTMLLRIFCNWALLYEVNIVLHFKRIVITLYCYWYVIFVNFAVVIVAITQCSSSSYGSYHPYAYFLWIRKNWE